jgi:hypothetical protein
MSANLLKKSRKREEMEQARSLIAFLSEIEDSRQARGKRHEKLTIQSSLSQWLWSF